MPEGILDGLLTSLAAMHSLNGKATRKNSRTGSVYIVKPKMHGAEEAAFTNELFGRIEEVLSLPRNTLKVGIMAPASFAGISPPAWFGLGYISVFSMLIGFFNSDSDGNTDEHLAGPGYRD